MNEICVGKQYSAQSFTANPNVIMFSVELNIRTKCVSSIGTRYERIYKSIFIVCDDSAGRNVARCRLDTGEDVFHVKKESTQIILIARSISYKVVRKGHRDRQVLQREGLLLSSR